jgi:subtilisin family serine protease
VTRRTSPRRRLPVIVRLLAGFATFLAALLAAGLLGVPTASAAPGPVNAPEYWFDTWHIPQLWRAGARGQGITIAEIDTGVNAQLPELAGRVLRGKDFGAPGDGRVDRSTDPFGHGTAMASIMVARSGTLGITGIAPGARILPIAVPLSGTTDRSPDDHVADAIRWAADHGAKIITMALGGVRDPQTTNEPCPSDEQSAIYYALRKGAIPLAAAGNQGDSGNAVEQPGVCLGVVSVGAVNRNDKVASFSARHKYVSFDAPGVGVPSLGRIPGQAYAGNGTSQATALASGITALVWSKYPALTGRQVVARLLATLDNRTAQPTPAYGYGILDGYRAVTADVPADAADPVYARALPFLERDQAFAGTTPPAPKPAATRVRSTGTFDIGTAPRLQVPQVIVGFCLGVAGLLALVALLVVPVVLRRRRPPMPDEPRPHLPLVDEHGVEWHQILGPEPPTANGA